VSETYLIEELLPYYTPIANITDEDLIYLRQKNKLSIYGSISQRLGYLLKEVLGFLSPEKDRGIKPCDSISSL
jgi:hypothetical protein